MRIPTRSPVLGVLIISFVVSSASAQDPAPPPGATSEIRVEFSAWGQGSIFEGAHRVGSIGLVRSDLERTVRGSDEAALHAQRFRKERMNGHTLIAAGTVVSAAIFTGYARHRRLEMGDGSAAAMLAGATAIGVGSHRLVISHRALAQALDEYNGSHRRLAASERMEVP